MDQYCAYRVTEFSGVAIGKRSVGFFAGSASAVSGFGNHFSF